MAELEAVIPPTTLAIWVGLERTRNRHDDHPRLSASSLGDECDRKLWYGFRWVQVGEQFDGRKLSIFETGEVWEERLVRYLTDAGMEVDALDPETGEQHRVVFCAGHASGRTDGKVRGVPEAPKTEHVLECKSHNNKSFGELKRKGVKDGKPAHYAQMQTYMHHQGLTRSLYLAVNKNDDDIYVERVEYDAAFALNLVAKAERIVRADTPPPKLHEDPDAKAAWQCRFCMHLDICHQGGQSRRTCRSCLHATAEMDGDGRWSCARLKVDALAHDDQRAGGECPHHRFLPGLVPGEQTDFDEVSETITYRMVDGSVFVDGGRAA